MLRVIIAAILMLCIAVVLTAQFGGGSGTEEDPWIISEVFHFIELGDYAGLEYQDKYYLQTADIDLGVPPYNEGEGWLPIIFRGNYDGNGFMILNLTINRPNRDSIGFFEGIITGSVKNIGFKDVSIVGRYRVGGITGYIVTGSITNSFVTGSVKGAKKVGGFAGNSRAGTIIRNSYSTANIRSNDVLEGKNGGLVGSFSINSPETIFEISYSYVTGSVSYDGCKGNLGALAGHSSYPHNIINSFWNTETTGMDHPTGSSSAKIIDSEGKSNEQMLSQDTFRNWDFDNVWSIQEGETYPYLMWQRDDIEHNNPPLLPPLQVNIEMNAESLVTVNWSPPSAGNPTGYRIYRNGEMINSTNENTFHFQDNNVESFTQYIYYIVAEYGENSSLRSHSACITPVAGGFAGGMGTEHNPFQVETAQHLDYIRYNTHSHYVQTSDIDLTDFDNWKPIKHLSNEGNIFTSSWGFAGSYNGNGYTISNLTINTPQDSIVGLFGFIGHNHYSARLTNIRVVNADITASAFVGGIVGIASSSGGNIIDNCHFDGNIINKYGYAGGLIGLIDYASKNDIVSNCSSYGSVTTVEERLIGRTGGLIGKNQGGLIDNCFSMSDVSGFWFIGGLIGENYPRVVNSYSAGNVTGISYVGGLFGYNYHLSDIVNCYWDMETSGQEMSAGGEGRTTAQMTYPYDTQTTYVRWDFDEIWTADIDHLKNNGYPYLKSLPFVSVDDEQNPEPLILTLTNYPNPFNPDTAIEFNLPQDGQVELDVFNIKGQKIRNLHNSYTEAGKHFINWNGKDDTGRVMPSGIYFYRITTEKDSITRKMMMVK